MKIKQISNLYEYQQAKIMISELSKEYNLSDDDKNTISVYEILFEHFERRSNFNPEEVIIEPTIDQIFDKVYDVKDLESKGIVERGLKLGEEYGELSAEILKLVGFKKNSLEKEKIKENILLESTDCLIMIFDIMKKMGFTKEQISEMADRQISKWISYI